MLQEGQVDLLATLDNESSDLFESSVTLTMPFVTSKQQVIGRADSNVNDATVNLTVRQVAVKKSSPSWDQLSALAKDYKTMELLIIPEQEEIESILNRIKIGQYDLAVMDSIELPEDLEFRHNLEIVLDISDESHISWGISTEKVELQTSINQFLSKKGLESEIARSYKDDFPLIKQRKLLRVITHQSPINYYYENGKLKGFEYDLVNKFSEHHGLRLDVVVADSQAQMLDLLNDGKGDIIAASLPESTLVSNRHVKLSEPYNFVAPVLVGRRDEQIIDVKDLAGRTIHLSMESPYAKMLSELRSRTGIRFSINQSSASTNNEAILYRIAEGRYDLTVLSSHEVKAELSRQVDLAGLVNLGEPMPLTWAVRDTNTQLLSALNEYLNQEYRKGFYNVIHARYIDKPDVRISNSSLIAGAEQLSPYDDIVHKYADLYGFDWRLVIAQMYQESRFNPHAVSYAGAEGLMQILPQTAEMIGVTDLRDPDANIKGGLSYMYHIHNLFEDTLTVEDRTWFTLASYNAGYRRVQRARKLAESMGLNKNTWFNNVEIAMLRMAVPRNYNGYQVRQCRCGQTAVYVREIRTLYNNYLRLTEAFKAASSLQVRNDES
ncbi:MAG: transporter substrate-binding domain-containing protein, partial [Gammaproteobacteria bacterium]|nr:transporter substrate-binding domain-containing protein [Gammaproteobacteria bacterium]